MVFNSCGKLVGKCWILHRFSQFCAVYAAHGVFFSCGKAKSGRSGKREQGFCFFRLSSTFPQEFSTHSQKEILKKAKIGRRPTKKRWSGGKEIKKRNFSRIFSTLQKEELWAKSCHISRFGGFSTVSAGSTNITNNSLYHSFVIALRAKRAREDQERNHTNEDRIQSPKRKRLCCSPYVCRFRQIYADCSRGHFD